MLLALIAVVLGFAVVGVVVEVAARRRPRPPAAGIESAARDYGLRGLRRPVSRLTLAGPLEPRPPSL